MPWCLLSCPVQDLAYCLGELFENVWHRQFWSAFSTTKTVVSGHSCVLSQSHQCLLEISGKRQLYGCPWMCQLHSLLVCMKEKSASQLWHPKQSMVLWITTSLEFESAHLDNALCGTSLCLRVQFLLPSTLILLLYIWYMFWMSCQRLQLGRWGNQEFNQHSMFGLEFLVSPIVMKEWYMIAK